MRKHVKIYCDYFGIGEQDFPLCEWCCHNRAVDVHHIEPRGRGGKNPKVDVIENLMGLCRECHQLAEAKLISKEKLQEIHEQKLKDSE